MTEWIGARMYNLGARFGFWIAKFKLGYETFSTRPLYWKD